MKTKPKSSKVTKRSVAKSRVAPPVKLVRVKPVKPVKLPNLDVADNFRATVRAGDFLIGHSTRHGTIGRALVDGGDTLFLNFAGDWPKTTIQGIDTTFTSNFVFFQGSISQNREKGGAVKAMAKINRDGSIERSFNGVNSSAIIVVPNSLYDVTFPFQVDDRYISVTPFWNDHVGNVAVSVECVNPMTVRARMFRDRVEEDEAAYVKNEFFIIVY